jgi:hypothetical protein
MSVLHNSYVVESIPITLSAVESILLKIDDTITVKEIDSKRQSYSVVNALSLCLKNSIACVLKPDPKADDEFLGIEDSGIEPLPSSIDNFKGAPPVNKVYKDE